MDTLGSFNLFGDVFDNTFDDEIFGEDLLQWDFPMEIYKELEGGDCHDPINSELLGPVFQSRPLNSIDYETPDQRRDSHISPHDKLAHVQELDLLFHTTSPISELGSSESCISENYSPPNLRTIKRCRSKRVRKSNINPWLRPIPWSLTMKKTNRGIDKERMKNWSNLVSVPVTYYQELQNGSWQPMADKKCTHCEVTKTPLWREGPLGRQTLCNACGVRYKSGRLLPEYRPAASPTFVPLVHSNSHKKVIQLRKKREKNAGIIDQTSTMSSNVFDF